MKTFLAIALLIASSVRLMANIGEDEFATARRYGVPYAQWDDYLGVRKLYYCDGMAITVNFSKGVSWRERFTKADDWYSPVSKAEARRIYKAKGVGKHSVIAYDDAGVLTIASRSEKEKYEKACHAAVAKQSAPR